MEYIPIAMAPPGGQGGGGGGFGCPSGAEGQGGGGVMGFLPIILIFAILYFIMIRPQQKKQKEHQKLISELQKGDKVITSGGMHGVISSLKDETVIVKIADNVKVEINRSSVTRVLEKSAGE